MSKKDKKPCCENCANCIYICEGDYYCDEEEVIVLYDFSTPTKHYLKCNGEKFEEGRLF